MFIKGNLIIYNADDEDPKCSRCDECYGDFDCSGKCGPEHSWYGYSRAEIIEQ